MSEHTEWFINSQDVIAERWNKAAKDGSKWDRTLDRDGITERLTEADEMEQTITTQATEIGRLREGIRKVLHDIEEEPLGTSHELARFARKIRAKLQKAYVNDAAFEGESDDRERVCPICKVKNCGVRHTEPTWAERSKG